MKLKILTLSILLSVNIGTLAESNLYDTKLTSLKGAEGAVVSNQQGWTIIQLSNSNPTEMWSFTPKDHPAHPAFVKRTLSKHNGSWHVKSEIKCGATKQECDKLVKEFNLLDERMKNSLSG